MCLERSENNWVREITPKEAIPFILQQTIRPENKSEMINLLTILDKVLRTIKVYRMGCNMDMEAVEVSYNSIKVEEKL